MCKRKIRKKISFEVECEKNSKKRNSTKEIANFETFRWNVCLVQFTVALLCGVILVAQMKFTQIQLKYIIYMENNMLAHSVCNREEAT